MYGTFECHVRRSAAILSRILASKSALHSSLSYATSDAFKYFIFRSAVALRHVRQQPLPRLHGTRS